MVARGRGQPQEQLRLEQVDAGHVHSERQRLAHVVQGQAVLDIGAFPCPRARVSLPGGESPDNGLQVSRTGRHVGKAAAGIRDVALEVSLQPGKIAVRGERMLPAEHLPQHHAAGVEIGGRSDLGVSTDLLRGAVRRRTEKLAHARQAVVVLASRQPEVQQHDPRRRSDWISSS